MHVGVGLTLLFSVITVLGYSVGKGNSACPTAPKCNPASCKLPDCFCSGNDTTIEGSSDPKVKPQIVYLTFDDALSREAATKFYEELFGTPTNHKFSNPNGCALRATHYITHSYTDYSLVNKYWHYGHEIASHSITHRNNQEYWAGMSEEQWVKEIVGQRKITGQFAAIDPCEISGMRAPYLQIGGDTMYSMLEKNNFKYDCSWPTRAFGYVDAEQSLYPYTLDYKSVQDCPIQPCPTCAHPGLWVQPMVDLEDEWMNSTNPPFGNPCSMLDGCVIIKHHDYVDQDPVQVYDMLMKNFQRVYNGDYDEFGDFQPGNRAPWGLYMHAAWFFGQPWHYEGYKKFIETIAGLNDVWIVPVKSGLDYMQYNDLDFSYSNDDLIALGKNRGPFACDDIENQTGKYDHGKNRCGPSKACKFNVTLPEDGVFAQERYMTICSYKSDGNKQNCPEEDKYPWLETDNVNACGGNVPCADCVP